MYTSSNKSSTSVEQRGAPALKSKASALTALTTLFRRARSNSKASDTSTTSAATDDSAVYSLSPGDDAPIPSPFGIYITTTVEVTYEDATPANFDPVVVSTCEGPRSTHRPRAGTF
ncbi:hypothetical protein EXIGLDRAFT_834846 [Exidia glandulosa HHB12029]|uniref:Uncharacterized protein n=1 Tax=Exidia glandulosa HHB12029 TaxID=1314781 RepID=A0A165JCD9_EXIGL|nr:hypothetical protein EXIGLDRAFT_834846 [Exidia glandulosa HHB12029]